MSTSLVMLEQLPTWFTVSALAILGAIWGSFAGALCHRWPRGESIIGGRSHCDHCRATLGVRELIPILSYAVQKGQCRDCGNAIGRQALAVELFGAALGAGCALLLPMPHTIIVVLFGWLTLPLLILDWRHLWLPDALLLWLAAVGLMVGLFWPYPLGLADRLIGGAAGFAVLETIRRAYARLRGVAAMGAGDPKLLGAIGLWTGWLALPQLLLAASVIGLVHFLVRQDRAANAGFPFGSYLCLAALLWLAGDMILIDYGLDLGIG